MSEQYGSCRIRDLMRTGRGGMEGRVVCVGKPRADWGEQEKKQHCTHSSKVRIIPTSLGTLQWLRQGVANSQFSTASCYRHNDSAVHKNKNIKYLGRTECLIRVLWSKQTRRGREVLSKPHSVICGSTEATFLGVPVSQLGTIRYDGVHGGTEQLIKEENNAKKPV